MLPGFGGFCPDLLSLALVGFILGRSTDEFLAEDGKEETLILSLSPLELLNQCLFRGLDEIDGVGDLVPLMFAASR